MSRLVFLVIFKMDSLNNLNFEGISDLNDKTANKKSQIIDIQLFSFLLVTLLGFKPKTSTAVM